MRSRPWGVSGLSAFFAFGTTMSGLAAISLLRPGSLLEPMWVVNPHGRAGLGALGMRAVILTATVSFVCVVAAVGLWIGKRWGRYLAIIILTVNATADLLNAWLMGDPRTLIGLPITAALLFYLRSERVRGFFAPRDA